MLAGSKAQFAYLEEISTAWRCSAGSVIHSPTYLLSYSSPTLILSPPITRRDAVIPLLTSTLYPESGGEYDAVFSMWLSALLWVFRLRLAACLQVWKELQPLSLPKPSHMPDLPLLLHLNLALQGLQSHCFLQTDLFRQMDEVLAQHLVSAMKTSSRK